MVIFILSLSIFALAFLLDQSEDQQVEKTQDVYGTLPEEESNDWWDEGISKYKARKAHSMLIPCYGNRH